MALGSLIIKSVLTITGKLSNTTAVSRGHVVVFTSATDPTAVARATSSSQAKVAGVAIYDIAGDTGSVAEFVRKGLAPVKNTSGSAISQGAALLSHASGGVKARAAETAPLTYVGEALEDIADGELGLADVDIRLQVV